MPPEPAFRNGQVLAAKYRVGELIASGGYADVFAGVRRSDGLRVAIKALRPATHRADPAASERFVREAALAAHLRHPNLVHILDFGETHSGVRYMVMEYLVGEPLSYRIFDAPMAPERVAGILRQVLDALSFAHAQATIHRDLKPSNVFLCTVQTPWKTGDVDWVKLLDFGFAKGMAPAGAAVRATLTLDGEVVGTPGYVAPELLEPGGTLSPLVDLYSAGVVAYEMLCGAPAFPGEGLERASQQVVSDPAPPPRLVAGHPIFEVVRRLHARSPADRFPNAEAALTALDRAVPRAGRITM